jgi:hypothetical protein
VENYLFTPQRDHFVAHFHLAGSAPHDDGAGGPICYLSAAGFEVQNYLFKPQRDHFVAHFHLAGSAPRDDGKGAKNLKGPQ